MPTESEPVRVVQGDCREQLPLVPADSFDSVVTDPPYELGFMGKAWDRSGVAFDPATWAAALRVLKPGGYMLAMGGTRTYHRLACAVEDAGFELRDCLMWMYGTGFPKGQGCLKPAWEPILLARKPGKRVLPLGIDGCRVPTDEDTARTQNEGPTWSGKYEGGRRVNGGNDAGRYPANVLHDGGDAAELLGTAARFFYCAKASKAERGEGNTHATVKPLSLMRWMVRLVTPEGGRVLDPFAGSGSTLLAAAEEGRGAVGVELDPKHCDIARRRIREAMGLGKGSLLAGLTCA